MGTIIANKVRFDFNTRTTIHIWSADFVKSHIIRPSEKESGAGGVRTAGHEKGAVWIMEPDMFSDVKAGE